MDKKFTIPYQICYLVLAGLMVIGVIFSLFRGSMQYTIQGIILAAFALFFAMYTTKDKLTFGAKLDPISDSMQGMISGNPIISFFTGIDIILAWIYIGLNVYFDLGFTRIISKIPVFGVIDDLLFSVSSVFYYVFLLALLSLFIKKQFRKIVLVTGVYTGVMLVGFVIDFFQAVFSGFSILFYSSMVPILFFGYLFALFNECTDTNETA